MEYIIHDVMLSLYEKPCDGEAPVYALTDLQGVMLPKATVGADLEEAVDLGDPRAIQEIVARHPWQVDALLRFGAPPRGGSNPGRAEGRTALRAAPR